VLFLFLLSWVVWIASCSVYICSATFPLLLRWFLSLLFVVSVLLLHTYTVYLPFHTFGIAWWVPTHLPPHACCTHFLLLPGITHWCCSYVTLFIVVGDAFCLCYLFIPVVLFYPAFVVLCWCFSLSTPVCCLCSHSFPVHSSCSAWLWWFAFILFYTLLFWVLGDCSPLVSYVSFGSWVDSSHLRCSHVPHFSSGRGQAGICDPDCSLLLSVPFSVVSFYLSLFFFCMVLTFLPFVLHCCYYIPFFPCCFYIYIL